MASRSCLALLAASTALWSCSCEPTPERVVHADSGHGVDAGAPVSNANLRIIVTDDDTGEVVPARGELTGLDGKPRPLTFSDDNYGVTLGRDTVGQLGSLCLFTGDGEARIAPGRYDLTIQRGIEYDVVTTRITVPAAGQLVVPVHLPRAFQTPGWIGGDFHVHSYPSGDSTVPAHDRAVSMAIEGVGLVVSSDHNHNFDLSQAIADLGLQRWVFGIAGNEITLDQGHWNVFPVPFDDTLPRGGAPNVPPETTIQTALSEMRTDAERQIVQLNHPRLGPPLGYFTIAGWNPDTGTVASPPLILGYDSIELLNGIEAKREDDEQILKDWLGLMARGYVLAPMGNSDTHHIASAKSGSPRTYLRVPDARPSMMTVDVVKDAIRGRHTLATSGPWLDLSVNGSAGPGDTVVLAAGAEVRLHLTIAAANFVPVDRLRIYANGALAQVRPIPSSLGHLRYDDTIVLPAPAVDTFYVVVVDAQTPLPRELAGRLDRDTFSYAIAAPVFVDTGVPGFQFPLARLPAGLTSGRVALAQPPRIQWRELTKERVWDPRNKRWVLVPVDSETTP